MVLLSFLLVLAAAVTLVIGLLGTGLGLIYVSIACSLAAGIVLALAVVRSRPQAGLATAGPAPLPAEPAPSSSVATVGDRHDTFAHDAPAAEPAVPAAVAEEATAVWQPASEHEAGSDVPADVDEPVEAFEAGDEPAAEEPAEIGAARDEWAVPEEDWAPEPEPAASPAEPAAGEAPGAVFPIADYDDLRVAQIVPLLSELDPDELEQVREREAAGRARSSILNRIDALLGRSPAPAVTRAPARKAAAAKKAPAKAAASAKASAKKAAAAAKAATAKTAPVKKATAKKAAAQAPAKKAAATKKAAASKAAAPAKKAAAKKTAR